MLEHALLRNITTGLIYRHHAPHLRSVQAYFPSVVCLDHGTMLATLVLGEAFEAVNCHTHVARSTDNGRNWVLEGPIAPSTPTRLTSDSCRLTVLPDGELVAFMVRADRSAHPDAGLCNPDTLGFVPTELALLRSRDAGRTWSAPERLTPPLIGPEFELCAPVTPLRGGRWLLPTSTWRGWDGYCPNGMRMVAFVSEDRGASWPTYLDVMHAPGCIFWESKIVEYPDGRLLALAWGYDEVAGCDLPNQYAVSDDGGATWTPPRATDLYGQTLTPLLLEDGRLLCAYRRMDRPGLWMAFAHLEGERWVTDAQEPLWGAQEAGLTAQEASMAQNFATLRFGAPSLTTRSDGAIYLAFWCYEDNVANIRWFTFRV